MKIPRIKPDAPRRNKAPKTLLRVIALLSLIAFGGILCRRQSDADRSGTTPSLMRTSDSFSAGTLSDSSVPSDEEYDKLGMEKLAEMTALARHSEGCPEIPREWSAAFIVLSMAKPPVEEQVEAQERKMLALKDRIGEARWCLLYSVEMKEAYLVYQYVTH